MKIHRTVNKNRNNLGDAPSSECVASRVSRTTKRVSRVALSVVLVLGLSVDPGLTSLRAFAAEGGQSESASSAPLPSISEALAASDATIATGEESAAKGEADVNDPHVSDAAPDTDIAPESDAALVANGTSETRDAAPEADAHAEADVAPEERVAPEAENESAAISPIVEVDDADGGVAAALASSDVTLEPNGWAADVDRFNMRLSVQGPADSTNNVAELHLPQYVSLAREIQTGGTTGIRSVDASGNANSASGTTYTIYIEETSGMLELGFDMEFDQSEFRKNARKDTTGYEYAITATYRRDGAGPFEASQTFAPELWIKRSTASVSFDAGGSIGESNVVDLAKSKDWVPVVYLDPEVDYVDGESDLLGRVEVPSASLGLFDITDQNALDPSGNLRVSYDGSSYDSISSRFKIKLPLKLNLEKMVQLFSNNPNETMTIPFVALVQPNTGQMLSMTGDPLVMRMPFITSGTGGNQRDGLRNEYSTQVHPQSFDIEDAVADIPLEWFVWKPQFDGKKKVKWDDFDGERMSTEEMDAIKNVKLTFWLPLDVEWQGAPEYYNQNTRKVTLPVVIGEQANSIGGFKLRLQDGVSFKLKLRDGSDVLHKSVSFADYEISYDYYGMKVKLPKQYAEYKTSIAIRNIPTPISVGQGSQIVKAGQPDTVLYRVQFGQSSLEYQKDLLGHWYEATVDTDVMQVTAVEVNTSQLTNLLGTKKATFSYTTTAQDGWHEWDMASNLALKQGEHLVGWKLSFPDGLEKGRVGRTRKEFLTFKGLAVNNTGALLDTSMKVDVFDAKTSEKPELMEGHTVSQQVSASGTVTDVIASITSEEMYHEDLSVITTEMRQLTSDEEYYLKDASTDGAASYTMSWILPEKLHIVDFRIINTWSQIKYTTKDHPNGLSDPIYAFDESLNLAEGDYLTSIEVKRSTTATSPAKFQFYAKIDPSYKPAEGETRSITAKVLQGPGMQAHELSTDIPLSAKSNVQLGMSDEGAVTWAGGGSVYAGDEFEAVYKPAFTVFEKGLSDAQASNVKVTNPVFYFELPRWVSYVEDSFVVDGVGKHPIVSRVAGPDADTSYLKVEFQGAADSSEGVELATALPSSRLEHELKFKLRVESFAPANRQNVSGRMYADLWKTYEALNSDEMRAQDYEGLWDESDPAGVKTTLATIRPQGREVRAQVMSSDPATSINILQTAYLNFSMKGATAQDATLRSSIALTSGQHMDGFFDIANGGEDLQDLVIYVPVSREGRNDGDGPAQWSAKVVNFVLSGSALNVNVEFSTQDNPSMGEMTQGGHDGSNVYVPYTSVADFSQVTMAKITVPSLPKGKSLGLMATFSSLDAKTDLGDQVNKVAAYYAYTKQGTWTSGNTSPMTLTLTDTTVSGRIWDDVNANGKLDASETGIPGVYVYADTPAGVIVNGAVSGDDGTYSFTSPSLPEDSFLEIEVPRYKALTFQNVSGADKNAVSAFDKDSRTAPITQGDTADMNAGLVDAQELTFDPDTYTVRKGKFKQLTTKLDPAAPSQTLTFSSSDEKVATVDANGEVTGVSEGTAEITASFTNVVGTEIKALANVEVETNDAPVLTVPAVVELNQGDAWDPTAVPGFELKDDHDPLSDLLLNLAVSGEDAFAKGGKAETVGTYEVEYSLADSDGNSVSKTVKVKVHGLPYLTDKQGTPFPGGTPPVQYFRLDGNTDPFANVRAFWQEASDDVNGAPATREILPSDTSGEFALVNTKHADGTAADAIDAAGAYMADYAMTTPKDGKNTVPHQVRVRGAIGLSAQSIAVPATAPQTSFSTFKEFVDLYGTELAIEAGVDSYDEDEGKVGPVNLSDKVDVDGDFSKLEFTLDPDQTSKTIPLTLTVTDATDPGTYGDKTKMLDIVVTVLNVKGEAPTITFDRLQNPLQRHSTDEVKRVPTAESPALTDDQLYDKLLDDAVFSDKDGSVIDKKITKVEVKAGDQGLAIDKVDSSTSGPALRKILTKVGTYELTYEAEDIQHNVVAATRTIEVAGPTEFVVIDANGQEKEAPRELNFRKRDAGAYNPVGTVLAFHDDPDNVKRDQTTVTSSGSADLTNAGVTELTLKTQHHYKFWPGTEIERPLDTFRQAVLVHGPIEFAGNTADVEAFVGEGVDVTGVTASFEQALRYTGTGTSTTAVKALTVTKDAGDEVTAAAPGAQTVTYTAVDDVSGSDAGNTATLTRTVSFYGLPEITAPTTPVVVRTNATEDDIKKAIAATASVTLPDGTPRDLTGDIAYDLSDVGASGGTARLSVVLSIANGTKEETATVNVAVEVSAPPAIEASDFTLNVGDKLDADELKARSAAAVSDDRDSLTLDDVTVDLSKVALTSDGAVSKAGTAEAVLSASDAEGNVTTKTVNVRVNGLPVIEGTSDVVARVKEVPSQWDKITVSWDRAPLTPGDPERVTFRYGDNSGNGDIVLTNYRRVEQGAETSVDTSALNHPGLYKGDFVATTEPSKGTSFVTRTLKLHGEPTVTASSISIGVGYSTNSGAEFLDKFKTDLGIEAKTVHVNDDGTTEDVDLLTRGKVELDISGITFGKEGSYDLVVYATDEAPGVADKTVSTTVKVNIGKFTGTPPVIVTHDKVHRVSTDPVMKAGGMTYSEYLLSERFIEVSKPESGNLPATFWTTVIKKMEKVEGPSGFKPDENIVAGEPTENVDHDGNGTLDEKELEWAFTTPGTYRVTYTVEDDHPNSIDVVVEFEVAGPTEFGFEVVEPDGTVTWQPLGEYVQARQTAGGMWSVSGLRVRHQDMSGTMHRGVLDALKSGLDLSLDNVGVLNLSVSAAHHSDFYEDGTTPRPHDEHDFKVLVQGRPTVSGHDDPVIVYEGDAVGEPEVLKGVTAQFDQVDVDGKIKPTKAKLELVSAPAARGMDKAGVHQAIIKATDEITNAPDASTSVTRNVEVNEHPTLTHHTDVEVPTNATEEQVRKALAVSASYKGADGVERDLLNSVVFDFSSFDAARAGEYQEVSFYVPYTLDPAGQQRRKEGSTTVYIDQAPTFSSTKDDVSAGDPFDPLDGITFEDKEDGTIGSNSIVIVKNDVDETKPGTYEVVYKVSDSKGNEVELTRVVRVHGLPVIKGVPSQLSTRVGSLPAEPLQGVTASYMKAGDTANDAPKETPVLVTFSFDDLHPQSLLSAALMASAGIDAPGVYQGTYRASNGHGGSAWEQTTVLAHGLPVVSSKGLTIEAGDTAPIDVARLVAEAGLSATVQHVRLDGTIDTVALPTSAMSIVQGGSMVDAAKPGTYRVRVAALDGLAPAAMTEADVTVTVKAAPQNPDPNDPNNGGNAGGGNDDNASGGNGDSGNADGGHGGDNENGNNGNSSRPGNGSGNDSQAIPLSAYLARTGDPLSATVVYGGALALAALALIVLAARRRKKD